MADATISALSAAATADRTYEIPVNKTGANETVKVTIEQIVDLVSNTLSNTLSVANAASNKASVLSVNLDTVSNAVSVVSARLDTEIGRAHV